MTSAVVAGTYFSNSDGSQRSDIIRKHCKVGLPVSFERDSKNQHDSNAIAVFLLVKGFFGTSRKQIGFVKASTAERLAGKMDPGKAFTARVKSFSMPAGNTAPRVTVEFE